MSGWKVYGPNGEQKKVLDASFNDLTDTDVGSPTDGTFPIFDTGSGDWEKSTGGSQEIATIENTTNPAFRLADAVGAANVDSHYFGFATASNAFIQNTVAGDMALRPGRGGDMVFGTSTASASVTNERMRITDDGIITFASNGNKLRPYSKMYQTSAQTGIVTSTSTQMTFNAYQFDSLGASDTANNRFVVPYDGLFKICCKLSWTSAWTGRSFINLRINGSYVEVEENYSLAGTNPTVFYYSELTLSSGNLVTFNIYHQLGSNNSTTGTPGNGAGNWASMELMERT